MSLSILVVTYNCSMEHSQTISSLSASKVRFDGVRLCIWNNGPKEMPVPADTLAAVRDKGFEVIVKQTPWNAPLSWIYNYFIENFSSDRYVVLDHDSTLSDEYLKYIIENKEIFLGMPVIKAKGMLLYPRIKKQFSIGPYARSDKVRSAGSGLLISQKAIDAIVESYGKPFDENFALYGVDTSFFYRIHRLKLTDELQSIPGIEHSLSKLEIEGKETKRFRKVERSYELGLMLRHYPSYKAVRTLIKQLFKSGFGKSNIFVTKAIQAFFWSRHERCEQPRLYTLIK